MHSKMQIKMPCFDVPFAERRNTALVFVNVVEDTLLLIKLL